MGGINYEPEGYPIKRKCVLCKKKGFYDEMVDICKDIPSIQRFNLCKECLKELKVMLAKEG
jgi:hypothetical protein